MNTKFVLGLPRAKPVGLHWPPLISTVLFSTLDSQKQPTFTVGPEKTIIGSSVYKIHMELREGDLAKNQNIWSSRGAASYILTFEMILPDGRVQFCFSNSRAGRPRPIYQSGDRTRPPTAASSGRLSRPRPVAGSIGLGCLVNWTQPPSRRV